MTAGLRVGVRGVAPGTRCRVCIHPRRADIDAMLSKGGAMGAVAKAVGDPTLAMSIKRHRAQGHVIAPPQAPAAAGASGTSAVEKMRAYVEALEQVDTSKMSNRDKTGHNVEYRRALGDLARAEQLAHGGATESEWERKYRDLRDEMNAVAGVIQCWPVVGESVARAVGAVHGRGAFDLDDEKQRAGRWMRAAAAAMAQEGA